MIIFFAIGLALLIVCLQFILPPFQQKRLVYSYEYDKTLVEPGQTVTLTSRVRNISRLPVMYVGLSEYLPEGALPEETQTHLEKHFGEYRSSYAMTLPPHRLFTAKLQFHFVQRGVYTLGKYYLENGDYLGLRTNVKTGKLSKQLVVMPQRSDNTRALQALGGYIGEISVRRFILEDPVLTVGCREYTAHEPMKSIAWNQTARTGRMLVKQFDHTVEASATVLLNLQGGTEEDREECLRLTRNVCEELERKRISYDFYTNGDLRLPQKTLTWLAQGLGIQHYRTVMYGLGTSKCNNLTSFAELVNRCIRSRRPQNGYILITPPLSADKESVLRKLRGFSEYDVCVLIGRAGACK